MYLYYNLTVFKINNKNVYKVSYEKSTIINYLFQIGIFLINKPNLIFKHLKYWFPLILHRPVWTYLKPLDVVSTWQKHQTNYKVIGLTGSFAKTKLDWFKLDYKRFMSILFYSIKSYHLFVKSRRTSIIILKLNFYIFCAFED